MLNRIPLTKTATTTVMVDTLKTTMGSVLKQVAKELKIDLIEFDAKKENKADVVLCIDANTTAKTLLRSVSKGGSLVMCNTNTPNAVQIPYSASIFNDIHVVGFNMNIFMSGSDFQRGMLDYVYVYDCVCI